MRIPRVRFTLGQMIVAVAIIGACLIYARSAIREYQAYEPKAPMVRDFDGYILAERRGKMISLLVPPALVGSYLGVLYACVRGWRRLPDPLADRIEPPSIHRPRVQLDKPK